VCHPIHFKMNIFYLCQWVHLSAGVLNIPLKNYFCATFSFPPPSTIMLNLIGHWSIDYHAIQSNMPQCLYLRLHNVTINFLLLDCTQRYHRTMLLTAAIHISLPDNRGQFRQVLVHIALESITTHSLASASSTCPSQNLKWNVLTRPGTDTTL